MGLGFMDFRKIIGERQTSIMKIYTCPVLKVPVNGPIKLVPMTTDRFDIAIYDVNIVAEAFDQDKAMVSANIDTVPIAMKKGCATR